MSKEQIIILQNKVNSFMINKGIDEKVKISVAKEFNKTLDIIIELTDPITIEKLVRLEILKHE